jgi:DNA repair photolyase
MLRLPLEVAPLFRDWLATHYPDRAAHVMSLVRDLRGGKDYRSAWGTRMRGSGVFADIIEKRFDVACRRFGLNDEGARVKLDTSQFVPPARDGGRPAKLF